MKWSSISTWLVLNSALFGLYASQDVLNAAGSVGMTVFVIFVTYAMVPLSPRAAVLCGVVTMFCDLVVTGTTAEVNRSSLGRQVGVDYSSFCEIYIESELQYM